MILSLSDMLPGVKPEKQGSVLCPVLCPHFQGPQDLCTVCWKLSKLSRCYRLLWLIGIRAGFLLSANTPTPASHLVPAKAGKIWAVVVSILGGQKPLAAGWTTSTAHLGSIHQKRNISERHIWELYSLYLKADCSELYRNQSQEGTPPNCLSLELSTTQWTAPWYLIGLTFALLTPEVHYQNNLQYYQGMLSDCLMV